MLQRIKAEWLPNLQDAEGNRRDPVIGWATFVIGAAISVFLYWRNHDEKAQMAFDEYNLLNTACILGIPLIALLLFFRREPKDFGMTVGDARAGLRYPLLAAGLFAPIILLAAATPDAQTYYLWWMSDNWWLGHQYGSKAFIGATWSGSAFYGGKIAWSRLAYHELVMAFYMFGWEFFFRGFLLNGFRRFLPVWGAILLQAAFFTALHAGKPLPEMISSFPGAILMALLAIRCRSFVPCFLLHFLISAGNDGAVLLAHFHPYLPHATTILGAGRAR